MFGSRMQDFLFHWGRNSGHHSVSALNSLFREIWWSSLLTVVGKSIRCWTRLQPDGITLAAKDNLPVLKYKSSLLMHLLWLSQKARLDSNSDSLSVGSFTH